MTGYPDAPGWKDPTASRENAKRIVGKSRQLRRRILGLFEEGFIGSADDVADRLHLSEFSVRPRCTELLQQGKIERVKVDRKLRGTARWWLRLKRKEQDQ